MLISLLKLVPDKRDDVLEILHSVIDRTRRLPGCIGCSCYVENNGPRKRHVMLYLEQWQTKEDLQRHIRSILYQRIISAMELAAEAPEITFYEVSGIGGMELIKSLREKPLSFLEST